MEVVPKLVLERLQCDHCKAHLSWRPVYLKTDGTSICGRCNPPQEGVTRNKPYEMLASLVKFPCRNEPLGCTETLSFSETATHESVCKFQQYLCPVSPNRCKWKHVLHLFGHHCETIHQRDIVRSPHVLGHKILTGLRFLLLAGLNMLFLLKVKVCHKSNMIYSSAWLISDEPILERSYNFNLLIENRSGVQVEQVGKVARINVEDEPMQTSLAYLQSVLGAQEQITFTVSVTANKYADCKMCRADEVQTKLDKHRTYFCASRADSTCKLCNQQVLGVTLETHYTAAHSAVTHEANSMWRICSDEAEHWCIVEAMFGRAVCRYSLSDEDGFVLGAYTPLPSHLLHLYQCTVELLSPLGIRRLVRAATVAYQTANDWELRVPSDEVCFCVVHNKIDIRIDFKEK